MLITKTNPTGIDWYIQQLQTKLHNNLISEWGISSGLYKCYGRCYRNKSKVGYIAEVYTEVNDYKEVYWDDSLAAISFFGINGIIKQGLHSEADVHLVFFVNLNKLALKDFSDNTIQHRADNEVRMSVENAIGKFSNSFKITSIEVWLDNVLREYAGSYKAGIDQTERSLARADMHPLHCFRINLKLVFNPNKIC
jgi:hypothetical protein